MPTASEVAFVLGGYLWGSLSPSFAAARLIKGIDLRHYGSGNVGSANVGEQLGGTWTVVIGILDLVKGLAPVVVARSAGMDASAAILVSLTTVIGHAWPVFLGFIGGRGMATTVGVLAAWDLRIVALLLIAMAFGRVIGQVAPASLVGLVLLAPSAWLLGDPAQVVVVGALLALVVVVKRLEANRLPLPQGARERERVLLRRVWMDRDVPADQPWEERKRFD